jgi:hypothetical protein
MSHMEKLVAIASLGQKIYGRLLFQRLIAGAIMVAGLMIVVSILISAMLVGSFYAVYLSLLYYGTGQASAMMIIGVLIFMTTAMLIIILAARLRALRRMPQRMLKESSLTSQAMGLLEAFSDGLTSPN